MDRTFKEPLSFEGVVIVYCCFCFHPEILQTNPGEAIITHGNPLCSTRGLTRGSKEPHLSIKKKIYDHVRFDLKNDFSILMSISLTKKYTCKKWSD